jgi:GNAT superfamily N-acetyltransferase
LPPLSKRTRPDNSYLRQLAKKGSPMTEDAITVRRATVKDASMVAELAAQLLQELGGFGLEAAQITPLATSLLATEQYVALLACAATGEPIGLLTINECTALYLAGKLGWIQELYVAPAQRSSQVGHSLIAAAVEIAHERQWRRLEVNTPNANEWPRTVAFYRREGFSGESVHLRMAL